MNQNDHAALMRHQLHVNLLDDTLTEIEAICVSLWERLEPVGLPMNIRLDVVAQVFEMNLNGLRGIFNPQTREERNAIMHRAVDHLSSLCMALCTRGAWATEASDLCHQRLYAAILGIMNVPTPIYKLN